MVSRSPHLSYSSRQISIELLQPHHCAICTTVSLSAEVRRSTIGWPDLKCGPHITGLGLACKCFMCTLSMPILLWPFGICIICGTVCHSPRLL